MFFPRQRNYLVPLFAPISERGSERELGGLSGKKGRRIGKGTGGKGGNASDIDVVSKLATLHAFLFPRSFISPFFPAERSREIFKWISAETDKDTARGGGGNLTNQEISQPSLIRFAY